MTTKTTIEWTGYSWNPVTGCTKVSPGCDHCYAETFAERWRGIPGHPYEQGFDLKLWPERLEHPLHWKDPRVIFVNSMSDLFHARVPFAFVERVWHTMALTPRHTYQILTKRPDRMARFVKRLPYLSNVWLGTSIESQEYLVRASHLGKAPAAVRFISAEPLLGPLDLHLIFNPAPFGGFNRNPIQWLIAGGESGRGARPADWEWFRSLRDQCLGAGVAFFLKQLGGHPDKRGHEKAVLDGERWTQMPEVAA